jgi:hypothetical protein
LSLASRYFTAELTLLQIGPFWAPTARSLRNQGNSRFPPSRSLAVVVVDDTCGGPKLHPRVSSQSRDTLIVVVKVPGTAGLTLLLRQRPKALNHGSHLTSGDHSGFARRAAARCQMPQPVSLSTHLFGVVRGFQRCVHLCGQGHRRREIEAEVGRDMRWPSRTPRQTTPGGMICPAFLWGTIGQAIPLAERRGILPQKTAELLCNRLGLQPCVLFT